MIVRTKELCAFGTDGAVTEGCTLRRAGNNSNVAGHESIL